MLHYLDDNTRDIYSVKISKYLSDNFKAYKDWPVEQKRQLISAAQTEALRRAADIRLTRDDAIKNGVTAVMENKKVCEYDSYNP